ncbi:B12-binding domain-containing protein [Nocardioides sp.]|uniref:cobalamin B12-binding domain-containing protein n=1 Tax=Nocardioides sp. TaxID=35761 RepID=UPI0027322DFF|nr:cobalamin-dependent protein [Nocardioides sp.]MDP3889792.1 cobalamin-dependent protein [Nocardioides sp.]
MTGPGVKVECAAEIGRVRDTVADAVTDRLRAQHPDWIEGCGDQVPEHGVQDPRRHIDFLHAAIELDDTAAFRDHTLWCRDLLGSRGIGADPLAECLRTIRAELMDRLSPAAAEEAGLALDVGLRALALEPGATPVDERLPPASRLYLVASVTGRRQAALAVVRESMDSGSSPVDVYVDVFQSALYEVGRRWQTAGLTIAEEHMATATTQFIVSVLHEEGQRARLHRGTAVVTGVAQEQHAVGASIVANVLDEAGWDVRFLGTDLPHEGIVATIVRSRAALVAISVTMSGGVADAGALIERIRRAQPDPPRIIVGGAAFRHDPQLWRTVGADGFAADARSLAELARR